LVKIAIPWMILGVIVVAGLAFSMADTCRADHQLWRLRSNPGSVPDRRLRRCPDLRT
jgi:hypothetical protein